MKKLYLKKAFSVLLAMLMILSMAGISISAEWSEIISETTLDMASSSNYSESYGYNSVLENDYLHVPFVGGNGASPLNYDKCATINHAAFGYDATRTNNEVVIEIDYRPHYEATVGTANPTVECQFKTVTVPDDVTVTSPSASKTYMSLYKIDLATGQLSNAGTVVSSNGLVKDAWNTVSLVINLETGKYDTYVNGTLYATDGYIAKGNEDQNFRKVSVAANQLIVAKCNKVDAYAASESNTHHYIDVDNVHFYTLNDEVRVATDEVAHTYTVKGSTHTALGQRYLVDDATSSTFVVYADALTQQGVATSSLVAPVSGASVRVSSPAGMRFATQLNTTELGKLLTMQNSGMLKNVEIGTMIAPLDHVEAVGNFTASSFDAAGKTYLEVEAVIGDYYSTLDGVTLENGYDAMFVGSIVNIKLDNRDRDFAAVGYVKVTLFSGNEYYYYSYGYDLSAISTNYARNVEEVAESYYNDGGKDLADPLLATLETLMTDRSEMTQYIGDEVSDALTSAT